MTGDFLDALQEALDREGYSYALIAMHNETGDGEVRFCDANWAVGDELFRDAVDSVLDSVFPDEPREWEFDPIEDGQEGVDWEWEYYYEDEYCEDEDDREGEEWKYL